MNNETLLVEPSKILGHLPGFVFLKNKESLFLGSNQAFAERAGFRSAKDLYGKSDFDSHYSMDNNFKNVLAADQAIIASGEPILNIEECQFFHNKRVNIITNKYPLPNQHGEIIGIFGMYFIANDSSESHQWMKINNDLYNNSIKNEKIKHFTIEGKFGKIKLTAREMQCIKEILSGKTAKEIGQKLKISSRTVESYIINIKYKLNCYKKSELCSVILESNFFSFL